MHTYTFCDIQNEKKKHTHVHFVMSLVQKTELASGIPAYNMKPQSTDFYLLGNLKQISTLVKNIQYELIYSMWLSETYNNFTDLGLLDSLWLS